MNKSTITADKLGIPATPALVAASPERLAREAAQLNVLTAQLNREAGVRPPVEPAPRSVAAVLAEDKFNPLEVAAAFDRPPSKPQQVTHTRSPFNPRLLFYTGRLKAGKDFVAAATGATIFGFADPLYAMRKLFFGDVDKDKHGAREILQLFGQWGRGVVSAQYPLNASRASFTMMARSLGTRGEFGDWAVDWAAFGRSENLWLDAMLRRVAMFRAHPGNEDKRIACVNVRFANEHKALTEAGWTHFHVLCSSHTWEERIRAAGLDPKSPAMIDTSEQMAIGLDRQVAQAAQRSPNLMLRCVWSDDKQSCPTPKCVHTMQSFLRDLEIFS